jgi:hypothetical protein
MESCERSAALDSNRSPLYVGRDTEVVDGAVIRSLLVVQCLVAVSFSCNGTLLADLQ